jgi:hypothetical protein
MLLVGVGAAGFWITVITVGIALVVKELRGRDSLNSWTDPGVVGQQRRLIRRVDGDGVATGGEPVIQDAGARDVRRCSDIA